LVLLFSSIINYTKKSLRPYGLGDFSVRGVFLQPLFYGMSIDAGIALGIFRHKLTINIKDVLTNIKSEIMIYKKGE